MSTATLSARGASAYTQSVPDPFQPLPEISFFGQEMEHTPAGGWSNAIDELLRVRTLKDDWDGEGTEAPHPSLVDSAITLAQWFQANGFVPPDRVHVGVNATVYFEWHTSTGYEEVEVLTPADAEYRLVGKGSDTTQVVALTRQS